MERTFIKLQEANLEFIRNLRSTIHELTGKKPTLDQIMDVVISDYKKVFETRSDPDVLTSFRARVKQSRNLIKVLDYAARDY